uniref:FG-GAP repeat protein n=1 Tax=Palpitomonas bilix TaxID=652834 RepID=A0A7S3DB35_9EUKA|mmetsp:Transcript_29994/g.77392  ORF Transcript_29994/g.77392 Transcript_29994/m.77392 type:complete len:443 (+) Transcript_29994:73-1401(+)
MFAFIAVASVLALCRADLPSLPLAAPLNFTAADGTQWQLTPSGTLDVEHPSFLVRTPSPFTDGKDVLWITQFTGNPLKKGTISYVDDVRSIADWGSANQVHVQEFDEKFTWPNKVSLLPDGAIAGVEKALVVPDGFLVPGKSTGSIKVLVLKSSTVDAGTVVELAPEKSGYFYHEATWLDLDGDGDLDCLTARATKPIIFGSAGGQLVWLENPGSSFNAGDNWKLHEITDGPDILFSTKVGSDGNIYVFAPQFFTKKLGLYVVSPKTGTIVDSKIIDPNLGPGYCVNFLDVNGDGVEDLVASNHQGDGSGGIFAYDLPQDGAYLNGSYARHTLNSGFPVRESGIGQAAPGIIDFQPVPGSGKGLRTSTRPLLFVAGDGSESAYILTPSGGKGSYTYEKSLEVNGHGTVGILNAMQRDDGAYEILIPNYDGGNIFSVTLSQIE